MSENPRPTPPGPFESALPELNLPGPTLEPEDVRRAIQVLEAVAADRGLLASLDRELRKELLSAAGRTAMPERAAETRLKKALRRKGKEKKREHDRALVATTEIRALRREVVFNAPQLPSGEPPSGPVRILEKPRNCYVCKAEYRRLHFFYDSMCAECGDLNYRKRFQRAPLEGRVALITGARVKIGYQASLMLLRSGATVIATTRFPNDGAHRYAREPDFAEWSHRLHLHGLDLRHAPSVELFARHIEATHQRLDILINNAAQTVRRPPGFYGHLLEGELQPVGSLAPELRPLLAGHLACIDAVSASNRLSAGGIDAAALSTTWQSPDLALGIHASAALSLVPYALENEGDTRKLFPSGRLDADLQQVDLREMNSWRLTLAEVATAEMLEVHLVNAVAPFILCSKLKPLMLRDRSEPGHIVNVSAMEGSFSRGTKTDKHPHTNMAKAALNMMTLTSAPDYAKSRIFMNAADTGWVTDEDPALHAERKQRELDFQPPLDIVDGAARVVDPVFNAINTGELVSGIFFKDYKPTSW